MRIFQLVALKNREKNAGGCYPDALAHATTLAIMLRKLAREDPKDRSAMTVVALFLWLTQAWPDIHSPNDIPDFVKISGATPCREHAFRTYKDGALSWAEYVHRYRDGKKTHYLWQPFPTYLNALFQPLISAQSYETPFLRPKTKVRLFHIMKKKWRTPVSLNDYPRVRKDTFHQYLIDCALVDNTLTPIPRAQIVSPNRKHHKHADTYQRSDSDRVRYKLFDAYNRYLSRLVRAARNAKLSPHFDVFVGQHAINLIAEHPKIPPYLSQPGRITQTVLETVNGTQQSIRSPATPLGSQRYLEENAVIRFFNDLFVHLHVLKPGKSASKKQWVAYYNGATHRLALLFIVLTGTRPTHGISILAQHYWGGDMVFVKDKGRLRQIILCDYLQREIQHYRTLQSAVLSMWGPHPELDEMWFCLNDHGQPAPLSSRTLRQFMHQHCPGVVPYQLRHFFAQSAVNNVSSTRLLDQDIDRLMGHENLGEHLGSDVIFPDTFEAMKVYLNQYAERLGMQEFAYV
ncbi:hypothetical protein ATG66_3752 [Vibrio sp. ES.051]|uniref:hypothetical protein n=1 Tax=Vibrio sp. ES.051 TaxID=1761909 RepID=UPI000BF7B89C|nr:hypothetical protein [Vibrio sp. ES.051]PFG45461.1 hypothetical protein ATG66_3752 [Vibrio sp. ES.051]